MEILHDLKMQFIDLLLVRWIFGRQIGHKNYEDFEHPTLRGTHFLVFIFTHSCAASQLAVGFHYIGPAPRNPQLILNLLPFVAAWLRRDAIAS